jgi:hypothetical protein
MMGGRRKLHDDELYGLYSSPNIIRIIKSRKMSWAEHVAQGVGKKNAYRLLIGKPEGTRPLGKPRRRWVDNIKVGLVEVGLVGLYWIDLAQDRYSWRALVNTVTNLQVQ